MHSGKLCEYSVDFSLKQHRGGALFGVVRDTVYQVNGQMTAGLNYSFILIVAVTGTRFPFNAKQLLSDPSHGAALINPTPTGRDYIKTHRHSYTLDRARERRTERGSEVMPGYALRLCQSSQVTRTRFIKVEPDPKRSIVTRRILLHWRVLKHWRVRCAPCALTAGGCGNEGTRTMIWISARY